MSAHLRSMLGTLHPGGVILFKRNIAEAAQTHALLREAQKTVGDPDVSLRGHGRRHRRSFSRCHRADSICRRRRASRIDEVVSQAREADRPATSCAGIQHRLCAVRRPAVRGIEERVGLTYGFGRSAGDGPLRARVSGRTSRCRNPRLRQAFSRTRRRQPRQPSRSAVDRQDLEATLERRPRSLSRDAPRILPS